MSRIQDLLIPVEPKEPKEPKEPEQARAQPRIPSPDGSSPDGEVHFTIDFILDTICPRCYIGFKNLKAAIQRYQSEHPGATFEIVCSPFMLNPDASTLEHPPSTRRPPKKSIEEWTRQGLQNGIHFNWGGMTDNSKDSHKLLRLALESSPTLLPTREFASRRPGQAPMPPGPTSGSEARPARGPALQMRLLDAMLEAYWRTPKGLDDRDLLMDLGTRAGGFSPGEVAACLASEEWGEAVQVLDAEARMRGVVTAVPVFVIQRKYVVSGWQPVELFMDFFERIRTSGGR